MEHKSQISCFQGCSYSVSSACSSFERGTFWSVNPACTPDRLVRIFSPSAEKFTGACRSCVRLAPGILSFRFSARLGTATVLSCRICRDTRAHPPTHQRADKRNAFYGDSDLETARLTLLAAQAASVHRTIEFGLRKRGRFAPAFLAAAFLRFQGVEFEEEGRKAPLLADESAEEKTGRTSQGLALE